MSRLRIIGGAWRSRLIEFPAVPGLRPTPDRVRETLFNWLGQNLAGCTCLDLFAGSGALGFEAASRGARHVSLVERDARAVAALKRSAQTLGGVGVELHRADALEFLATSPHRYDVVFLDPPYGQAWLDRVEPALQRVLAPHARIYVEAEAKRESQAGWALSRYRQAGQVHYHLFEWDAP